MKLQSQTFTTAGTHPFSVPAGVTCVWLKALGGGASGGPYQVSLGGGVFYGVASGGGSGGLCMGIPVNVPSGTDIDVTVGIGGPAASYPQTPGNEGTRGGDSIVGAIRTAGGYYPQLYPATNDFFRDIWGTGGNAGLPGQIYLNTDGQMGILSSPGFFSGSSGGGTWNPGVVPNGTVGGPSVNGVAGGSPGSFTPSVSAAGGGGGSTPFGVGGTGGNKTTSVASNGQAPSGSAYGAGGGGGGVWTGGYNANQPKGGDGMNGYVMLSWVA